MPQRRLKDWKVIDRTKHIYSDWHRKALPYWCYMTDGDWFEQREINGEFKAVAYIETIGVPAPSVDNAVENYPPWKSKKSLCLEIEKRMKTPAYVVWHNEDCNDFLVLRITEKKAIRMSDKQYVAFLRKL